MKLTTLFTATLAVVLVLFIGWSLFSDSNETTDSGRIRQAIAENRSSNAALNNSRTSDATPLASATNSKAAAAENNEIAEATDSHEAAAEKSETDKAETEQTTMPATRAKSVRTGQTKGFNQQLLARSASVPKLDAGDMPNEKFVRDLERYQTISHRNYEEILRLAKQ